MRIKLTANRQTGANGVRPPTHWRSASVVVKVKDLLPGAAQLVLVRLRSYHWCGLGAAQLSLVRLRRSAAILGAATTADQQARHTDLEDVQPFSF
jgi:hypothetical protein